MNTKYDFSKLRGKIKEKLGSESEYAKLLNLSNSSISAKLQSQVPFSLKEIEITINRLDIPVVEISDYFFIKKVEK